MSINRNWLILTASLILTACVHNPPVVSRSSDNLPAKPVDLMQSCAESNLLDEMMQTVGGAEGIREDYLIEFAGRADKCRITSNGLQDFVNRTWER
jgi:hypothetical protein